MSQKDQTPVTIINSVAPIRICDNGGWTDTWFAGHGKILNIGVYPYAEVQIQVFADQISDERIVINAENYGERYVLQPEKGWDRHPLLEAAIEYMKIPAHLSSSAGPPGSWRFASSDDRTRSEEDPMRSALDPFYHNLARPLHFPSRFLLGLLVLPLAGAFLAPLWNIHMVAPQYPQGLDLDIYSYTVEGDIQEVNTLNHYIGMARIDRASLTDLDWIPFALGALVVLTLRVASIGDKRSLVDLFVLFAYFSVFSLGRFYLKLYVFGHNLDPEAPFDVEPVVGVGIARHAGSSQTTYERPWSPPGQQIETTEVLEKAAAMLVGQGRHVGAGLWGQRVAPLQSRPLAIARHCHVLRH